MAAQGKKKMKGKTLNLTEFLSDETGGGQNYSATSKLDWAAEMESNDIDDTGEIEYGRSMIDRSKLPTAPKAARGPDVDMSKIPSNPPFTAFIGNLPYETTEEKIFNFFKDMKVLNVRLPTDQGRLRGFGYVEFEDRQALIDALALNDETLAGRKIRVDLAGQNQQNERGGGGGFGSDRRNDGPDRTESDWRRGPPAESSFDRRDDRYGDRRDGGDRWGNRDGGGRGFDRDERGGSSWGFDRGSRDDRGPSRDGWRSRDRNSEDRGPSSFDDDSAPPRGGGFSDRGPPRDRYDDRGPPRDRYDDRGPPRDRYDDRGPQRDRYDDRGPQRDRYDRGPQRDRYDDRGGQSRGFDRRDRGGGFNRYDDNRDGGERRGFGSGFRRDDRRDDRHDRPRSRDSSREQPTERPRLNLQPRTKPLDENKSPEKQPEKKTSASSIFGAAKPVDTLSRELEIEERLRKQREEEAKKVEEEKENRVIHNPNVERGYRNRRDSENSQEGGRRERRLSSNSSSSGRKAPAPVTSSGRTRKDSDVSNHSQDLQSGGEDGKEEPKSPVSPQQRDEQVKLVPAPPPSVNIWEKRKTTSKTPTETKVATATTSSSESQSQSAAQTSQSPPKSDSKSGTGEGPAPRANAWSRGVSSEVKSVDPPKENPWFKNRDQRDAEKGARGDFPGRGRGMGRGGGPERGRGRGAKHSRSQKEKPGPKSIDEMPKYEAKVEKDWSNSNKFAGLLDDDNDVDQEVDS